MCLDWMRNFVVGGYHRKIRCSDYRMRSKRLIDPLWAEGVRFLRAGGHGVYLPVLLEIRTQCLFM